MATETLRPNAAGDLTDITDQVPGSTFHWDKVDEAGVNGDGNTTYVRNKASSPTQIDLYNLPASSGAGEINKITLYFSVRSGFDVDSHRGAIKAGGTVTRTGWKNPATYFGLNTWGTYPHEWALNPTDSEAWEWADIDDLQIGIWMVYSTVLVYACTQVYVEVDYTPVVNTTVTPTTIALSDAQFVPILKETTTPTTLSLSDTQYAPVFGEGVVPATLSLSDTQFVPVLEEVTTPTTLSLSDTQFIPLIPIGSIVTPTTLALSDTEYIPILKEVTTPTTLVHTITEYIPILKETLTPTTLPLSATEYAPAFGVGVVPTMVSLLLTGYAPPFLFVTYIPILLTMPNRDISIAMPSRIGSLKMRTK